MNIRQFKWIIALVLLLGMTSLACSVFGGGSEEPTAVPVTESEAAPADTGTEATAVPAPTTAPNTEAPAEPAATEAPAEEASADSITVNSLTGEPDFPAYRMTMEISITGPDESGNETTQVVTAEILRTKEPNATSMKMQFEGMEGADEFGETTFVQTEDASYMLIPGMGCLNSGEGGTPDNPFADFADTNAFLEEVGNAKFVGEETIEGIETLHYTFDQADFLQADADIEWADGHVYVAKDGGYVVRFILDGAGALGSVIAGENQTGTMHMEFTIVPVEEPVTIEIPAECENLGAENSEYPVLEDAAEYTAFGGLVSYSTATPFADIVSFYETELSAAGWVKDEGGSFVAENSSAILAYTKDGKTINITIGTNDDGQTFSVVIIPNE